MGAALGTQLRLNELLTLQKTAGSVNLSRYPAALSTRPSQLLAALDFRHFLSAA